MDKSLTSCGLVQSKFSGGWPHMLTLTLVTLRSLVVKSDSVHGKWGIANVRGARRDTFLRLALFQGSVKHARCRLQVDNFAVFGIR